ncbi:hypothetical protein QAD02_010637 [Eretmocerus hayati]|uniref:Uncharacterized protein n=1 Tax=Eretmocerus hayati TaxID=131215 RepID=A0ACC2NVN5_9HYME|nr:hypothetical protein QAD02_010637 [Eretmocerus hayati]
MSYEVAMASEPALMDPLSALMDTEEILQNETVDPLLGAGYTPSVQENATNNVGNPKDFPNTEIITSKDASVDPLLGAENVEGMLEGAINIEKVSKDVTNVNNTLPPGHPSSLPRHYRKPRTCAVRSCKYRKLYNMNEQRTMFSCHKNEEKLRRWRQYIPGLLGSHAICSAHFEPRFIISSSTFRRASLKSDAVPTLLLDDHPNNQGSPSIPHDQPLTDNSENQGTYPVDNRNDPGPSSQKVPNPDNFNSHNQNSSASTVQFGNQIRSHSLGSHQDRSTEEQQPCFDSIMNCRDSLNNSNDFGQVSNKASNLFNSDCQNQSVNASSIISDSQIRMNDPRSHQDQSLSYMLEQHSNQLSTIEEHYLNYIDSSDMNNFQRQTMDGCESYQSNLANHEGTASIQTQCISNTSAFCQDQSVISAMNQVGNDVTSSLGSYRYNRVNQENIVHKPDTRSINTTTDMCSGESMTRDIDQNMYNPEYNITNSLATHCDQPLNMAGIMHQHYLQPTNNIADIDSSQSTTSAIDHNMYQSQSDAINSLVSYQNPENQGKSLEHCIPLTNNIAGLCSNQSMTCTGDQNTYQLENNVANSFHNQLFSNEEDNCASSGVETSSRNVIQNPSADPECLENLKQETIEDEGDIKVAGNQGDKETKDDLKKCMPIEISVYFSLKREMDLFSRVLPAFWTLSELPRGNDMVFIFSKECTDTESESLVTLFEKTIVLNAKDELILSVHGRSLKVSPPIVLKNLEMLLRIILRFSDLKVCRGICANEFDVDKGSVVYKDDLNYCRHVSCTLITDLVQCKHCYSYSQYLTSLMPNNPPVLGNTIASH